jgi:hypothetical protein
VDLCTVDQVKEWIPIRNGDDDSLLERVVPAISTAVQNQIGRSIGKATYAEARNGNGKSAMMVQNYPIVTVASVSVDGVTIAPRTAFGGSGFVFDDDTIYLEGSCFSRGHQNVALGYDGGYTVVPLDLEQAVIESIAFLYKERARIGLASQSMAGETTSYLRELPPHLMRRIMAFARVATPP